MKKVLIGAGIAAAAALSYVLFFGADEPAYDPPIDVEVQVPGTPTTQSDPSALREPVVNDPLADSPKTDQAPPLCAQFDFDESHPWVADEFQRIEPFVTAGPGMSAYRGLSEENLESLAAQNDSGAMMVLGKRAEIRARGGDEDRAVSHLDGLLDTEERWDSSSRPTVEIRNASLADAERWYYQAALHGRVFSLFYVGMIRGQLSGGAVGLGWINEDDLKGLEPDERAAFMPAVVYGHAALLLAPGVMESPMMIVALEDLEALQGNAAIVEGVIEEFRRDVSDNGLTLPAVAPYDGPTIEEWRAEFCKDD